MKKVIVIGRKFTFLDGSVFIHRFGAFPDEETCRRAAELEGDRLRLCSQAMLGIQGPDGNVMPAPSANLAHFLRSIGLVRIEHTSEELMVRESNIIIPDSPSLVIAKG